MQLICKHCGHISKSLNVIKDGAMAEVMLDFSKHMTEKHNPKGAKNSPFINWMKDCQMLMQVGPTVILVAKHSTLLDITHTGSDGTNFEEEDYIQEKFSLLIDQIIQDYLGVEVFDNKPPSTVDESDKAAPVISDLTLPHMS